MHSPFPGMDPYLEQPGVWPDFHANFLARAQEILAEQLVGKYTVRVETRLMVSRRSSKRRELIGISDLAITSPRRESVETSSRVAAPVTIAMPARLIRRHRSLAIFDQRSRQVVTVVELLSPANKDRRDDFAAYGDKRKQLLASGVNFVEIDLLRGGRRQPEPKLPESDYYALVARGDDGTEVGFWPIGLQEQLPVIPIPLSDSDPDVMLDLREAMDRAYHAARYDQDIYEGEPSAALSPADGKWAATILAARSPQSPANGA